jgi:hypothetical protein
VPDVSESREIPDVESMEAGAGEPAHPDLEEVRKLVLLAHPDVVPELVTGETVAALLASVEPARSAYARLAGTWREEREAATGAMVPAGGGAPIAIDPDRLPAAEKIRRGLAATFTNGRKG